MLMPVKMPHRDTHSEFVSVVNVLLVLLNGRSRLKRSSL